jgi:DEAD/DEAH box helicase domain-containing protein
MESGRKHDVHHKVPLRAFRDVNGFIQTSLAHRLENLVTLCHTCHRRVETNVRIRSGLAGLAFTLGHLAPFFLMCDRGDIGVHSDPQSPISGGMPTIIIYDQIPAGIGFSRRLYEIHSDLMSAALHSIQSCPCTDGCPSCVGPGGENGAGGKKEAIQILKYLAPSD